MTPFFASFKAPRSLARVWALGILILAVSACGGGGSGPSEPVKPPPPPASSNEPDLTLQSLQGRWLSADKQWVARWLPPAPGQSSATIWLVSEDEQYLSVLNATVSGSSVVVSKGWRYTLDPLSGQSNSAQALDWRGTTNLKSSPATLSLTEGLNFTLQDPLKEAALQLNAVGSWTSNLNLTRLNLRVDELGVITGTSQTGCVYVGVLTARTDVSAYEAKLSETCAGAVQQFTGMAALTAGTTLSKLTLALVSANNQAGKVLYLQRQ
jgi:hypothetical protein